MIKEGQEAIRKAAGAIASKVSGEDQTVGLIEVARANGMLPSQFLNYLNRQNLKNKSRCNILTTSKYDGKGNPQKVGVPAVSDKEYKYFDKVNKKGGFCVLTDTVNSTNI